MSKRGVPPEKAAKVAAALVQGKSQHDALKEAGYSDSVARVPRKVVQSPMVQRALREAMEIVGITSDMIAGTIKDAMQANRIEVGRSGGEIMDIREVGPDHPTRLKAAAMATEIREGFRRKWSEAADEPRFVIQVAPEYRNMFFGKPVPEDQENDPPDSSGA